MIRKKKIKRVLKWILIISLLFVTGFATIILYPQPLFANKVEYRQFKVYSNNKINDEIKPILDSALSLVEKSELYDSTYKVDIFLAYNTFFNNVDDKVFGLGPTARAVDNNLVIKVNVDINKNLVYTTFHKPCQQSFTYIIAHEMVHCFQTHKYGIWKFNPLKHPEMWKLEGYPEYISKQKEFSDKGYSLTSDIDRYVNLKSKTTDIWISSKEGGCEIPDYYYKGKLMIEYLMDVKRLSYDQILRDTTSENTLFLEMLKWKDSILTTKQ